jgi:hypothetical protein
VAASLHAPTLYRVSDRFQQPYVSYYGGLAASVMIVAREPMALSTLALPSHDWSDFQAPPGRPWTDDYINMPRALWEGLSGIEECRTYSYLPRCGGDGGGGPEPEAPAEMAPVAP